MTFNKLYAKVSRAAGAHVCEVIHKRSTMYGRDETEWQVFIAPDHHFEGKTAEGVWEKVKKCYVGLNEASLQEAK